MLNIYTILSLFFIGVILYLIFDYKTYKISNVMHCLTILMTISFLYQYNVNPNTLCDLGIVQASVISGFHLAYHIL